MAEFPVIDYGWESEILGGRENFTLMADICRKCSDAGLALCCQCRKLATIILSVLDSLDILQNFQILSNSIFCFVKRCL
jgi:hypothetical protein